MTASKPSPEPRKQQASITPCSPRPIRLTYVQRPVRRTRTWSRSPCAALERSSVHVLSHVVHSRRRTRTSRCTAFWPTGVCASLRVHEERTRDGPPHWAQHRAAGPSGSQRICHTPPRVPMARCRCTRGRNPNPSRPSNTHPSNVLNSTSSRTVSFTFSFTQRMKPHGPYTPKSEEPGKSTIQGRIK